MVDLNTLLGAIVEAQANLTSREFEAYYADNRRLEAVEALQDAQIAFDAAVDAARGLRAPTPGSAPAPAQRPSMLTLIPTPEAVEPEIAAPEACAECGQPIAPGCPHACARMDGAPGPLPSTSPLLKGPPPSPGLSWAAGSMPAVGYAPEADDDREENTGAD